ncbi:calpain small subunit 1-like [Penaeus japonicus]|uniref:calpain small subunit 1-like n=1 Tax=Penaeus japonicus TaxID=27405 RepID=UPI001C7161F7|nr:calpain small subunit 1-like [Penaeus japonicus]
MGSGIWELVAVGGGDGGDGKWGLGDGGGGGDGGDCGDGKWDLCLAGDGGGGGDGGDGKWDLGIGAQTRATASEVHSRLNAETHTRQETAENVRCNEQQQLVPRGGGNGTVFSITDHTAGAQSTCNCSPSPVIPRALLTAARLH